MYIVYQPLFLPNVTLVQTQTNLHWLYRCLCETLLLIFKIRCEHSETSSEADMEVEESVSSRIKKLTNRRRNSNSFQSLAREIYDIKDLREAIWQCFILEIDESSKYLTQRHFSYLGSNTYEDLLTFRWECVVQEMLDHNPLLLETLLAVCLPRKSMNGPHFDVIYPEIGTVYGILMKRRCKDLSRVQRVISMSLAEEKVHQKVFYNCLINNELLFWDF